MSDGQGELRELIVRELEEQSDRRAKQYWVEGTPLLYGDTAREVVDAIMAAIADAGFSVVKADRLERYERVLRVFADNRVVGPSGDVGSVADLLLKPGDLGELRREAGKGG